MPEDMQNTFSFYSSAGNTPADMAYWFEGFLHSSGSILLLDDNLWNLVNNWICAQDKDTFLELLPILKRTFSEFSSVERRKLGEKAKASGTEGIPLQTPDALSHNEEEASQVIPVVCQLLGIDMK